MVYSELLQKETVAATVSKYFVVPQLDPYCGGDERIKYDILELAFFSLRLLSMLHNIIVATL